MDNIELIEDYLKGKLKGQELKNFEGRLASDNTFAREVEEQRVLHDLLFTQGLLETKEKLQAIRKDRQAKEGGNGGWKGMGWLFLSVLIITSVYVLLNKDKTPHDKTSIKALDKEENKKVETIHPAIENNKNSMLGKKEEKIVKENRSKDNLADSSSKINDLSIQLITPDTENTKQINHKTLIENQVPAKVVKADPCSQVNIKAKILKEASCLDKATGKLHMTQLTGGKHPYTFILNDSPSTEQTIFTDLNPGKYHIRITDDNGCIANLEAEVESKNCQPAKSNIFAPDYGETWKFPINTNGNCKIRIYDASGTVIYEVNTVNGHPSEWNGTGINESYIKAGAYIYQISCEDGLVTQGAVTVTR